MYDARLAERMKKSVYSTTDDVKRGFHPTQRTQRTQRNERKQREKRKLQPTGTELSSFQLNSTY